MPKRNSYDAVVVGSGPNGMAAAITLAGQGLSVLVIEARDKPGGGVRSAELTLPGFTHDICSSVFALAQDSPVFGAMDLHESGLEYIRPEIAIAHPLDDGDAGFAVTSVGDTAANLGADRKRYEDLYSPLVAHWPQIRSSFVSPLHLSALTKEKIAFASGAIQSGASFARSHFETDKARALFAGMAAHSMLPLTKLTTASIGLVLNIVAHVNGWPLAKGGAQKITDALEARLVHLGGIIETGRNIGSLGELPSSKVVLLDVTPKQLLSIVGDRLSALYQWQLKRFEYGPGVFKIDWALSEPVPFINGACRRAGTVHIGGSFGEIIASEAAIGQGGHPDQPFVLFVQPTVADPRRAPHGRHIAWGYCHVPNGSTKDMTAAIEKQLERFAPGFRDCILARSSMNSADLQAYNSNYVGGDINGGASSIGQLFTRPVIRLSPYRTSARGIFLCSSSTPPGGGVHGIPGYYAARRALKDEFGISLPWL